jgi:hypothetical protein
MCYQLMNIESISENDVKYENEVSSEAIPDQTSDISIDATYPSGYCMFFLIIYHNAIAFHKFILLISYY